MIAKTSIRCVTAAVLFMFLVLLYVSSVMAAPGPDISGLVSPTHADENTWYSNNDPSFSWSSAFETGLAGSYSTPGHSYDVAVSGIYAYIADGGYGLRIINISNPASPTLAGFYDTPAAASGLDISGSYAYVADDTSLQIINISNPASPTLAGSLAMSSAVDVAVSGDFAYVASYGYGLRVIDISNPASPALRGTFNTPGIAVGVALSGNHAYVADNNSGLQIIDVTDPDNPAFAGAYNPGYSFLAARVSGTLAYMAAGSSGLVIVDISDPANTSLAGAYDTPGSALDVAVSGIYAYMADYSSGLQILDISNPANPTLAGSYATLPASYAEDVDVSGSFAYLSDYTVGLTIVEASTATGYSYIFDQNPATVPDTVSEGADTSKAYTDTGDGIWYFHVRAVDPLGNWGAASHRKAQIDTGAPVITNILPSGTITTGDPATVQADLSDSISGIDVATGSVSVDGTELTGCVVNSSLVSCDTSSAGFAEGAHSISVTAYDNAGNPNTATGSFSVDSIAPSVTGIQPGGTINTTSTTISADYSDSGSGIDSATATVYLDSVLVTGCTADAVSVSCPVTGLSVGAHSITVYVSDNAGNTGSGSGSFTMTLSRDYYWGRYDGTNSLDWILLGNPPGSSGNLTFDLYISTDEQSLAPFVIPGYGVGEVPPGQSITPMFNMPPAGPVKALSTTGGQAIASQRILWKSRYFEEVPGIEAGSLSSHYYWTWYDQFSPGFSQDEIIVVNTNTEPVMVEISFTDVAHPPAADPVDDTFPLQPAGTPGGTDTLRQSYPGKMGGPVEVKAWLAGGTYESDPRNVVATQRVIKDQGAATEHLNEVPGIPADDLTSDYWWTWYDWNSSGASNWVLVSNPGAEAVHVDISFRNDQTGTIETLDADLPPAAPGVAPWTPSFAGKKGGPVEVRASLASDHNQPRDVIASQRSVWTTFFEEVPGFAASQLSPRYLWTWYDWNSAGSQNWVMVANPTADTVHSEISFKDSTTGETRGDANVILQPAGSNGSIRYLRFDGYMGGPVEVKAYLEGSDYVTSPRDVIASQRVLWNGQFNEVLGTLLE
ncbi:MAG: hypothetical protein HZB44_05390 [Actinobacteria bacterium]|nr:hypothetical protein [Actinomycetota bacterium]